MKIPNTTDSFDTLVKFVLESSMPLDEEERDFLNECLRDEYLIYGMRLNVVKLTRIRILFHMACGYLRGKVPLE